MSDLNNSDEAKPESEEVWIQAHTEEKALGTRPFLKGPIPWEWLHQANGLGGSALITGLAIWHIHALRKSPSFVTNSRQLRNWTRMSEGTTRDSMHRLEKAGLVKVKRPTGTNIQITLIKDVTKQAVPKPTKNEGV